LFFFVPGPQQQGRLAVSETGAHADRPSHNHSATVRPATF
jgi:hypothetical protein